jgi:hypothetical protein
MSFSLGIYIKKEKAFTVYNVQKSEFVDIQNWALTSTDQKSIFIIPPDTKGFRIDSERAIYGDWKDGTQTFFNPSFGFKWINRMENLGYKDGMSINEFSDQYNKLDLKSIRNIINEPIFKNRNVYLVKDKIYEQLSSDVVYQNDKYIIYEVAQ